MSNFNYDRAQVASLGAFSLSSRSPSTTLKPEVDLNRKKPQVNQRVTTRVVQLELDLPVPNQLELDLKGGPKL